MSILQELVQLQDQIQRLIQRHKEKRGILIVTGDDRAFDEGDFHPHVHVVRVPAGACCVELAATAARGKDLHFFGWLVQDARSLDAVDLVRAVEAVRDAAARMPGHVDLIGQPSKRMHDVARLLSAAAGVKVVCEPDGYETYFFRAAVGHGDACGGGGGGGGRIKRRPSVASIRSFVL